MGNPLRINKDRAHKDRDKSLKRSRHKRHQIRDSRGKLEAELASTFATIHKLWIKATTLLPEDNTPSRAKMIEKLTGFIHTQIQIYMTNWQEQANAAVITAADPVPKHEKAFFLIALAGNVVWASVCLSQPHIMLVASIGGAILGSGTAQQVMQRESKIEDAKEFLLGAVANLHGTLEDEFLKNRASLAEEIAMQIHFYRTLGGNVPSDPDDKIMDLWGELIWRKMFPAIDYTEKRYNEMLKQFREAINSSIADFLRQYEEYRNFTAVRIPDFRSLEEQRRPKPQFQPVLHITVNGKKYGGPDTVYYLSGHELA